MSKTPKPAKPLSINIVIPTLNASRVLDPCLKSIKSQKYLGNINIQIVDADSTDVTIKIAQKYRAVISPNPLKTGEAGKAVGLKQSKADLILFLDSDNILPHPNWLAQMVQPFIDNPSIFCSEPIAFTYRPHAGFIERYCSLLGANDPYAWFTGIYDRFSLVTNSWTSLKVTTQNQPEYVEFFPKINTPLPTIGANGTLYRRKIIQSSFHADYLFDTDLIGIIVNAHPNLSIAKVKTDIIHTFAESSPSKFYTKQLRRVRDFYYYKQFRQHSWNSLNVLYMPLFTLYTLTLFGPLFHSLVGFSRRPDFAWFFHLPACIFTLFSYGTVVIQNFFGKNTYQSRHKWSQ